MKLCFILKKYIYVCIAFIIIMVFINILTFILIFLILVNVL